MSASAIAVNIAAGLDLICGLSIFAISVLLYPILKRYNERIALWYVGLRIGELIGFVLGGVLLFTLLSIAKDSQIMGSTHSEQISWGSKYLLDARGHTQNLSLLLYCFGASMFYYLLLQSKLVPRFIAVWGLVGLVGILSEILMSIFDVSTESFMYYIMLPMGLNEIFLGFWLLIKGLNIGNPLHDHE